MCRRSRSKIEPKARKPALLTEKSAGKPTDTTMAKFRHELVAEDAWKKSASAFKDFLFIMGGPINDTRTRAENGHTRHRRATRTGSRAELRGKSASLDA